MPQQESPRLTRNNFDLLRLLFAGIVLLFHASVLSGYDALAWMAGVVSASAAVKAFFVISGFLIFMSYERSSSLASYAGKRIRRIYPAYFTVVVLCAVGLFFVSTENAVHYFSPTWFKYLLANLTFLNFLQPTLPGVFLSNSLAAVNGALWTLKIEATFYISVPLLVLLFRKYSHFPVMAMTYGLSVAYVFLLGEAAQRTGAGIYQELARQLPGQMSYFISGAFFYYFLPIFERRAGHFMVAALLVLVADRYVPLPLMEPFALATLVIFCGLYSHVGNFCKYGDFSYGVYILHFPIIQILVHTGWLRESPWLFLGAVIMLTAGGAMVMWNLVEKPFLLHSSHYVTGTPSSGIDARKDESPPDTPERRDGRPPSLREP